MLSHFFPVMETKSPIIYFYESEIAYGAFKAFKSISPDLSCHSGVTEFVRSPIPWRLLPFLNTVSQLGLPGYSAAQRDHCFPYDFPMTPFSDYLEDNDHLASDDQCLCDSCNQTLLHSLIKEYRLLFLVVMFLVMVNFVIPTQNDYERTKRKEKYVAELVPNLKTMVYNIIINILNTCRTKNYSLKFYTTTRSALFNRYLTIISVNLENRHTAGNNDHGQVGKTECGSVGVEECYRRWKIG